MDNAMLERIQTDGNPPKATNVSVTTRAELAVAPAPVQTEMRERPVVASTQSQRSSDEEERVRAVVHVIGHVRNQMSSIGEIEAKGRKLDENYTRLVGSARGDKGDPSVNRSAEAEAAAKEIDKMISEAFGSGAAESSAAADNAAEWALRSSRERTEDKIELALQRVGVLQTRLSGDRNEAYDRLLNIKTSITGLNIARSQVDDSNVSIANASSTVDAVMTNLRSMVTAHGNVSPEIVRLILS